LKLREEGILEAAGGRGNLLVEEEGGGGFRGSGTSPALLWEKTFSKEDRR